MNRRLDVLINTEAIRYTVGKQVVRLTQLIGGGAMLPKLPPHHLQPQPAHHTFCLALSYHSPQ